MDVKDQEDPVGYLIKEMEAFILRLAGEMDRLKRRIKELEDILGNNVTINSNSTN